MLKTLLTVGASSIFLALQICSGHAMELTDVAGRKVTLDAPAKTIVLGDGRVLTVMAMLDKDNPVERVDALLSNLKQTDPVLMEYMKARYPKMAEIPMVLGAETGVAAEAVIAKAPDVAILSMSGHGPGIDNKEFIDQLEAAGIAVVFIDFRQNPKENTTASVEVMGKVLGREEEAAEFIAFYNERKQRIVERLKAFDGKRPSVFLQAHIGRFKCCVAMAQGMLGPFVDLAGGRNISAEAVPGPVGRHTLEFLLTANPDIWIGTASGTPADFEEGKPFAVLGMNVEKDLALRSAQRSLESEGLEVLDAVKNGNAYTIWHGFYNSPFNIYVLEAFAKWFHPDLFADVDPEATFAEIHRRFLPLENGGLYSVKVRQ
ncbi:ABC transporter substrate-binding protein [uncultured Roseibium sp.]|uniref:ABC transporter substrate-binding protein n=1 Tax=uncultured Roseibium sp. TaxID=1936171 RepID=UPI003217ABC2